MTFVRLVLLALTLPALGCATEGDATPARSSAAPADTALISADALRLAGFSTAPVSVTPWRDSYSAPARLTLDAAATEPIGSIVEGRVVKVFAMPGDVVRRGAVLVAIHSHELMDARAALVKARAELTRSESELRVASSAGERAERLFTLKALSQADLERARATRIDAQALRDGAAAELTRSEAMIDHLVGLGALPPDYDEHWVLIRAPIDGVVVNREVQPGNVVLLGAPLMTVSRTSALTLVMQLPDASVAAARVGAPVRFTVSAFPDKSFDARVTRVFPAIDTVTRTVEVQAAVNDPSGLLRPEMFATAELLGSSAGNATTVPSGAIQALDGDTVVIEAQRRGEAMKIEAIRVRVGRRTRERVELVAGIDTGRLVIVGGASVAKAEIMKQRTAGSGGS